MKVTERVDRLVKRAVHALGGTARAKVVLVLSAVLALDGADKGTVSATVGELEHAFGIDNTAIGLLVSVVALTGAAFTIPVGLLTDRIRRTRLLTISVALWAGATVMSGAAPSYVWLFFSRAALGAVSATAGPTVASLIGDFFPIRDRARMYGFILCGELVGVSLRFAVSGTIGVSLGWRLAFWWLSAHVLGSGGGSGTGLEYTLLVFLVALLAAGLLGLVAMRTYPRDVATAEVSTQEIAADRGHNAEESG
jgi:MFS family permease